MPLKTWFIANASRLEESPNATSSLLARVAGSARLQTVALDHTRLDHAGVLTWIHRVFSNLKGQEHDAGVQVVASFEGGCQAHFHRFRQAWTVALNIWCDRKQREKPFRK